jgi:hypothetical protein
MGVFLLGFYHKQWTETIINSKLNGIRSFIVNDLRKTWTNFNNAHFNIYVLEIIN